MAYASLADVKAHLSVSVDTEDARITAAIESAEAAVDQFTGRRWEVSASEARFYWPPDSFAVWVTIDDAQSVTAVAELDDDLSSWTDLPADGWMPGGWGVDPAATSVTGDNRITRLLRSAGCWRSAGRGTATVRVTGTWGYTAAPPDDIKQAALILAARYFERADAPLGISSGGLESAPMRLAGIDPDVRTLLVQRRRTTVQRL